MLRTIYGICPDWPDGNLAAVSSRRGRHGRLWRMTDRTPVRQLRLCVTAPDYDTALRFYRDVLGLTESGSYTSPAGDRVTILDAGIATLELAEPGYAAYIDEVEVGRRVAGPVRVAFEVDDCRAVTDRLAAAGAGVIPAPARNARGVP